MKKLVQSVRLHPARTMVAVAVFTAGFLNLGLHFEDNASGGDISLPTLAVASAEASCETGKFSVPTYLVAYKTLCDWTCYTGGSSACPIR